MNKFFNLIDKKFKKRIGFYIFLVIFQIALESVSIALIPLFISFIVNSDLILNIPLENLRVLLQSLTQKELIYYLVVGLIILFICKATYSIYLIHFQSKLIAEINFNLKDFFFRNYLMSPYEFINGYNTSDILRNLDDITSRYTSNFFLIINFFKDLIMTLMIFLILIFVDFFSATISLLILIFISFFYLMFWKKKLEQIGKIQISSKRNMFKWIIQSLSMIKEIIITNKTARAVDEYLKNVFLFEQSKRKMQIIQGIPSAFFELLIVILILISILFVTSAEIENPIPILSLYTIAAIRLLPIFSRFSSYMASIHSILPAIKLLQSEFIKLKIIDHEKEILNKKKDKNQDDRINFTNNILIKDLSFRYNDSDKLILNKINLKINKGSCVAFVGKSGSGKTTLINLIAGLLAPSEGEIFIDENLNKYCLNAWQKKIGLLSQDNYLIDETIKNNIVLLNDDSVINEKKLENAILFSGVKDISDKLPKKLDTMVGEKGTFFSSGQIQRIALARLLYRDPEVLILDEFTNSLDHENEKIILKNLENLKIKQNKTIIMISHKMKPLRITDKIFILNNSKIESELDFNKFYEDFSAIYD